MLGLALLVAAPARGELRNVLVNGFMQNKDEDRCAETVQILSADAQDASVPAIRLFSAENGQRYGASTTDVIASLKAPFTARRYESDVRVFLSFYVGLPGIELSEAADAHFDVRINGFRVFQRDQLEAGWRHYLIDMAAWRDTAKVRISFCARWNKGAPHPLVVALPRIVAWHGPYYEGWGGLSSGHGKHGKRIMMQAPSDGSHIDRTIRCDRSKVSGGALLVQLIDAVRPASIRMRSGAQDNVYRLEPGECWMPLALGNDPDEKIEIAQVGGEVGDVEEGWMDVIPNFMADDGLKLKQIEDAEFERN